jgi:hypothetical protein
MKFVDFVKVGDIGKAKLNGCSIEVERRDDVLWSVTLTDESGHVLKMCRGEYSGFEAYVPKEPK